MVLICFADIKKHKFYYQVAYPCRLYKEYLPSQTSEVFRTEANMKDGLLYELLDDTLLVRDYSSVKNQPGWILRKILTDIQLKLKQSQELLVICVRDQSYQFKAKLDPIPESQSYAVIGYEHLKPEIVDISKLVDPMVISKQATTLNLQLMKWRLAPSLDLDAIAQSEVLILGVGTLGCNVIRVLMGWNVTNLTIVDNGTVSYSNLNRQPLYSFDDYGKVKVEAAKQNIILANPHMNVEAVQLTIPAPGHHNQTDKVTLVKLQELIQKSDVVFLLTDSRETRYFPTLLSMKANKLCINAALGFDSYLLMRQYKNFGCYFCSDVVGPRDSLTMRTLDEQCTVTRPGLAAQCAAQAVEMYVQLLQHPQKFEASHQAQQVHTNVSEFGQIPHIIRYYQRYFQSQLLSQEPFEQCCACSPQVQEQVSVDFMLKLLEQPSLIDIISGLQQLKVDSEDVDVDWDSSSEQGDV